jgi:glycosyltransferase involved in cell wall biosynthesis
MDLSVIIPSYGRPQRLSRLVSALCADLPDACEIIAVLQGADGADVNDPRMRTIRLPRPSLTAARNAGIDAARGAIVLFLDDDCLPSPQCVARHIELHRAHTEYMALAGGVRDANHLGKRDAVVRFDETRLDYVPDYALPGEQEAPCFPGGHVSFKRGVFDGLRFDPWFIGNAHFEEVDLAMRMRKRSMRIYFSSGVWIDHAIDDTGGCRAATRPAQFMRHRFYNRGLCWAKNVPLVNLPAFLTHQRHSLEYLARAGAGHDPALVAAGLAGLALGMAAGVARRRIGDRRFR